MVKAQPSWNRQEQRCLYKHRPDDSHAHSHVHPTVNYGTLHMVKFIVFESLAKLETTDAVSSRSHGFDFSIIRRYQRAAISGSIRCF